MQIGRCMITCNPSQVPILSGGFVLCYRHEANFHILGMLACFLAAVFRGAKSILQATLLSDGHLDSISLLYYMAPWSGLLLFLLSFALEGSAPVASFFAIRAGIYDDVRISEARLAVGADLARGAWTAVSTQKIPEELVFANGAGRTFGLVVLTGFTACLLNIFNFLVTYHTGPVVLQILGNVGLGRSCKQIRFSVFWDAKPPLSQYALCKVVLYILVRTSLL